MNLERVYTLVAEWPLPNGDRVIVTRAEKIVLNSVMERHFTWRVQARNGQTVAGGGELYTRKSSAVRAARRNFPPAVDQ